MHSRAFQSLANELFAGGFHHAGPDLPIMAPIFRILHQIDLGSDVVDQIVKGGSPLSARMGELEFQPCQQCRPAAVVHLTQRRVGPSLRVGCDFFGGIPDVFAGVIPIKNACRIAEVSSLDLPAPTATVGGKYLFARLPGKPQY